MTEFAHTYGSEDEITIKEGAASTLVLHRTDGKVQTVDSDEMPALTNTYAAIDKAMFAIEDHGDRCELYRYGEYYGKAEYCNMTPNSWFSDTKVVFSIPCE